MDQMNSALLALPDLSAGYEVNEMYTGPITVENTVQARGQTFADYLANVDGWTGASTSYLRSGLVEGARIRSWLITFATIEDAIAFQEHYREISDDRKLVDMSFQPLGDNSFAVRGTPLVTGGVDTETSEIVFRELNVVGGFAMVSYRGLTDMTEFEKYAILVYSRLNQLLR